LGDMRMKKGLPTKKTDVTDSASMKNLKRSVDPSSVNPPQVLMRNFAIRKVAEVAGRIAAVGNSNVAQRRATVTKEPQHIPNFGLGHRHSRR